MSDNNIPAFPQSGGFEQLDSQLPVQGMSLRDYFAAKAMQARMTAFCALETWHGWSNDEIAKESYSLADAMLAERAK